MAEDSDWHAPNLWRSKFLSVLAGELRRQRLTLAHAEAALARAEERMRGGSHLIPSHAVLRLIPASHCTAYDLEFVALAQVLQVPLYTLDREILRDFPATARPLN